MQFDPPDKGFVNLLLFKNPLNKKDPLDHKRVFFV